MTIDEEKIEIDVQEEEVLDDHETEAEVDEEQSEEAPAEEQEDEEDVEDRVVTIGEEEETEESEETEHQETPGWVKKVRKTNREQARRIKKLERQLQEATKPAEETVELGPKPTLESSGFDDKKFEKNLIEWHERSRQVEAQKAEQQKKVDEQNKAWQEKQQRYADLKQEHKFKDFSEAEETVTDLLDVTQQGVLVQGADDPALLVYALGKNPKKAEELAKIKDPVEFAFKLAKVEAQLKVRNRKAPAPEKRISGGKSGGSPVEKTLERLLDKAEKTNDYSEYNAYKRSLRGAK